MKPNHWEISWEEYHYTINRQDRKLTIRNMIHYGLSPREAISRIREYDHQALNGP